MRFGILGPLVVGVPSGEVLRAAKPRALLVRLLLDANRSVPADRLVEDLWEGTPPQSATQTLQTYVSQLRRALGADRVVTDGRGYRVVVHPGELDVERFEKAVGAGRAALERADGGTAVEQFDKALSEWRGSPLGDVSGASWATADVARLEELRLAATECLLEAQLAMGRAGEVVVAGEAAIAEHPLRERLWAHLITGYYRQGRQAEALRAYQRLRARLAGELGIDPSPELQALERAVLAQDRSLAGRAPDPESRSFTPLGTSVPTESGAEAPTGTVTFVFTDVEGSSHLWETEPETMNVGLLRHDQLLRECLGSSGGRVFKATGDGVLAAFADARAALVAAIRVQSAVADSLPFRVRIALHSGAAERRDGDYFGPTLNRAARLLAIGHGGQVLASNATEQLVQDRLPTGVSLRDLGEHRLRDLARPERVFQLIAPGLDSEFPRLLSLDHAATNLPVQLTGFVGRVAELGAVGSLLDHHRMVTLTGPGGVGKTRLAIQVAAELLDRFSAGVWLVELASTEAPRVVEVIAAALGVIPPPGQAFETCLVADLRSRQLLVVLDNCEHLVREVRRISEIVLREAPEVSILATSREGLRVQGEQLFSVPSLDEEAAFDLFVERAQAVDPAFVAGADDQAAITEVCARLDGIPLAIELAAARVAMFTTQDLARRVTQRFRLLTGGRGTVERHQTLRAAIDWSYDLLSSAEKVTFDRLSVFAGGCTLEAAEAVIADSGVEADSVLDLLSELVGKSLVVVDRTHTQTRYDISETIRQYGEERLVASGDAEAVRARHARWYADFARTAGRGLYSADELAWLERLQAEVDNLQIAVAWAVGADETELAMRLGAAFVRQAMARPLLGTAALAERAIQVSGADQHPLRARVMAEAAWAKLSEKDLIGPKRLLYESIEAQQQGARYASAAYTYLLVPTAREDSREAYDVAKKGLRAAEAAGDVLGAIGARIAYATFAMIMENESEALDHAQQALADARQLRQPSLEAGALYAHGLALSNADPARALSLLHQSIDICQRHNIESEQSAALAALAAIEAFHGDERRALEAMLESMATRTVLGALYGGADLVGGSHAFNRVGRPDLVARLSGLAYSHLGGMEAFYGKLHRAATDEARATLGETLFEQYATQGASSDWEDFWRELQQEIEAILANRPPS